MVTELIAIKKALEKANDSPFSNTKNVVFLYTDSISAIYAIQNFPPKDNHKLIFDIIYQINKNFEIRYLNYTSTGYHHTLTSLKMKLSIFTLKKPLTKVLQSQVILTFPALKALFGIP